MSSTNHHDLNEFDGDELGAEARGSTRAMWNQRRPSKQRTRTRAKRRAASMASKAGIHQRRNKRVNW